MRKKTTIKKIINKYSFNNSNKKLINKENLLYHFKLQRIFVKLFLLI